MVRALKTATYFNCIVETRRREKERKKSSKLTGRVRAEQNESKRDEGREMEEIEQRLVVYHVF